MTWRKSGRVLLLCAAGLIVTTLLLLLAGRLALEGAPRYQAEIKEWVHARIGYRVEFAHVWPVFRWHGPELYFSNLELRSADGARVLARAAGGRVGADVWQLIRSGKLLAGRIELDAPEIVIIRTTGTDFALAAEMRLGDGGSLSSLRVDDLPAGTVAIRHGVITVRGWNAALPEIVLRDVNLTARRGNARITLAADANLPPALGGALSATATARGGGRLDAMEWSAHGSARKLPLLGWGQLLPDYLYRLGGGTVGFDSSASGVGSTLAKASLDFTADNVTTQLTDEKAVIFDQLSGSFSLAHVADRWTLMGRNVRALRAGHRDPDSEFDASWRANEEGLLELRTQASYLRAETLLPLAGLLPQKVLRERLLEAALTGEWLETHVDLRRSSYTDPWQLDARAQFRGVGFAPIGGVPGIRGLSGSLAGTEGGGRIDIDAQRAVFNWPGQLPQPVDLQDLKTTLFWRSTPDELLIATRALDVQNRDARVHARIAYHRPADGSSPTLALVAGVEDGNLANTKAYLPRQAIGAKALSWLNRAFPAGHMSHADVVFQGPLRQFPFRDGSGQFLARAQIDGLVLDYQEGWPRAENVAAVAEFHNEGLDLQLHGGRIGNLTLGSGDAHFADFRDAELLLRVNAAGDAGDALGYLRSTPLDALAEHMFTHVEAKGPIQAEVELFLPFKDFARRHSLVHAHLHGVALNRTGSPLTATELTGDADVDGAQVAHADVHGKVLGGQFQMQARAPRNRPVTRTILTFNGALGGDELRTALSLPPSMALDGSTDWHAVLRIVPDPARERSLHVSASLVGLDLALPQPLRKPAGVAMPASVDVTWPPSGGEQVRMTLGSVLRGQLILDADAAGPLVKRAALTFGPDSSTAESPAFSDTQTLNAGGSIERLDLAGWLRLYTPDRNAKPLASLLRNARFEVARIDYLGLSFMNVAVELAATDTGWRVAIGGPNVTGSIVPPSGADPAEPWKLQFDRLKFSDDDTPVVVDSDPVAANPHGIPAIDFHAADVVWGERQFGEVRATLRKLDDGIALRQLSINGGTFTGNATGEWRGSDAGEVRIEGSVTSTDIGAALKQLGYDAVIEAKSSKLDFDLSWQGAPSADALSGSTGHVQAALEKGQITGIKPGAGRVVGLASLAALPRRLALDFSDLTDKGLAFDTVRGNFDLRDGNAYTDDVLLKGPAAEIGLIGRVGLKNKDYDQTAVVTGNVSSSLPLAAFAAGPIIGGAVLLFTQVFKQPLKGLARGYYRITGEWDNPSVERIKSGDAAAATAEATK